MIITRSPLRISLGGGGTDLPSYYRKYTGFLIAAAIDKYVCMTLHQTFVPELILKYSQLERVKKIDEVQHPIIREGMRLVGTDGAGLELTSMADIPAGTGLGSSGSFTVALLKCLHSHFKNMVPTQDLAEQACHIEIDRLGEPIGKQDQYAAAFGGINTYVFHPDDTVEVKPLRISSETLYALEDNLMLFFTGYSRSASGILREQDTRSKKMDQKMIDNLHFIKHLGHESKEALETGNLRRFAELMHSHWEHKRNRSGNISNDDIDRWYQLARENGALSGKLIGAGGGGFLMFFAEDKQQLRRTMTEAGLREVRFRFDFEGAKNVL